MSRSFLGIPLNNYQGALTPFPTKLCGQAGIVIPVSINWINYHASSTVPNNNQTVIVNLNGNAAQPALPEIRSVFIDNTNSNVPIYVFFPDTGHSVTCAPNAEIWAPVYTNGRTAWIVGEGFVTGLIPATLVLFTNIFVQPFTNYELAQTVDLWKASPTISRGETIFNSNYGTPSLGDTNVQAIATGSNASILLPFTEVTGFVYLNALQMTITGDAQAVGVQNQINISGPLLSFWRWDFFSTTLLNFYVPFPVVTGLNLKLDLTQGPYNLSNTGISFSSFASILVMGVTYNPT